MSAASVLFFRRKKKAATGIDCLLTGGAFSSGMTFARASAGYRFNASKILVSEASDIARFAYDPVSGAALGLLYEDQATNLLKGSRSFSTTSYWSQAYAPTLVGGQTDRFGGAGAFLLTNTTTSSRIEQIATVVSGSQYAVQIMVKDGGVGSLRIRVDSTSVYQVDFNTTSMVGTSSGSQTPTNITMKDIGGGFFLCSYTFTAGTTTAIVRLYAVNGTNFGSMILDSAQLEAGTKATSPILTVASAATRAADVLRFAIPSGVTTLRYTFDDNSTQDVSVSVGVYTVPTTLSRSRIKRIQSV